jgi:hypothetical protein
MQLHFVPRITFAETLVAVKVAAIKLVAGLARSMLAGGWAG